MILKAFLSRADIGQQVAFMITERNEGPLVKNDFFIPGVHFLRARLYQLACLLKCHRKTFRMPVQSKASPRSRNKGIRQPGIANFKLSFGTRIGHSARKAVAVGRWMMRLCKRHTWKLPRLVRGTLRPRIGALC